MWDLGNIFCNFGNKIRGYTPISGDSLNFSLASNCDRKNMETVSFVLWLYFSYSVACLRNSHKMASAVDLQKNISILLVDLGELIDNKKN